MFQHKNFRGIINQSVHFWKNEIKIPKPCCASRENNEFEETCKKSDSTVEQLPIYIKKNKLLSKEFFKTVKPLDPEGKCEAYKNEKKFKNSEKRMRKNEKLKYNDWKAHEDILLMKLCNSQFHKKWKKIAHLIGGKTPRKCAYRIKKLEKHLNNFETMKSKLNIICEQALVDEYRQQLNILSQEHPKKKKKLRKIKKNLQLKDDFKLTLDHFKNLDIEKKPEIIEIQKSIILINIVNITTENFNSLTSDYEMKKSTSNTSSRSNSIDYERKMSTDSNSIKEDNNFEMAFNKVFNFNEKEKYQHQEINLILEDKKPQTNVNFNEICDKFFSSNELKIRNYYDRNDLINIDIIFNSNEDFNSKKIKLTNYLMELNQRSIHSDSIDEKKILMQIQAKLLEYLIILTKTLE